MKDGGLTTLVCKDNKIGGSATMKRDRRDRRERKWRDLAGGVQYCEIDTRVTGEVRSDRGESGPVDVTRVVRSRSIEEGGTSVGTGNS